MNPSDNETGNAADVRTRVIFAWDEVFGSHLQVRGGPEEARRLADLLMDEEIEARADCEGTDRLRRDGHERVMLCEPARDAARENELREVLQEAGCVVDPGKGAESVPCPYGERLRSLLRRGNYFEGVKPPTAAELGLGAEDGPELLRMAADPEFDCSWQSDAVWAPVWAWFLLGELKPAGATELLVRMLSRIDREDGDDAASSVLPKVFGRIGPELAPQLTAVLRDEGRRTWSRWAAVDGLTQIARAWPESRAEVVAILTAQLEGRAVWSGEVNGAIVDALLKLKAVESAAAIEQAFRANRIDETIAGDWDEVRAEWELEPAPGPPLHGAEPVRREGPKAGRNDPCPCGSGKKFKKCCGG